MSELPRIDAIDHYPEYDGHQSTAPSQSSSPSVSDSSLEILSPANSPYVSYDEARAREELRYVQDVEHARAGRTNAGGASHAHLQNGAKFNHGTGQRERLIAAAEERERNLQQQRARAAQRAGNVVVLEDWIQRELV